MIFNGKDLAVQMNAYKSSTTAVEMCSATAVKTIRSRTIKFLSLNVSVLMNIVLCCCGKRLDNCFRSLRKYYNGMCIKEEHTSQKTKRLRYSKLLS